MLPDLKEISETPASFLVNPKAMLHILQELFILLSSLIGQHAPAPTRRVDKITGKLSTGFQFFTRSLPCLNIYREWFYPEGIKVVPNDIAEHLTARGLAHWLMQDGYKHRNCVKLATNCFTEAEVNLLIELLYSKFGLSCTQQRMGKGADQKAIYVRRKPIPHFLELIRSHMHPSMLYKLPTK